MATPTWAEIYGSDVLIYSDAIYGDFPLGPKRATEIINMLRGQQVAHTIKLTLRGTELSYTETVIRGSTDTDKLQNDHLSYLQDVTVPGYINGTHFQTNYIEGKLKWFNVKPTTGTTYTVTYTFFPDIYIRRLVTRIVPAHNSIFINYLYQNGTEYEIRGGAYNAKKDLG